MPQPTLSVRPPTLPRWSLATLGLLALGSLCVACSSPDGGADGSGGGDGGGEALEEVDYTDVSYALSEDHPTIATVEWTTDEPTRGWVRMPDGRTTPKDEAPVVEHSAVLLGLAPDLTLEVALLAELEDGVVAQLDLEITTGSLSGGTPDFEFELFGEPTPGFTVVPLLGDQTQGVPGQVLIIDSDGRVVWRYFMPLVTVTSASLDVARGRIIANVGYSVLQVPLLGGDFTADADMEYHHQTVVLPDGTLATLRQESGLVDGEEVVGDAIIELLADGSRRVVWDVFEADAAGELDFDLSDYTDPGAAGLTLTHGNTISYDEEDDWYVVGMPGIQSIVAIERSTGTIAWALNQDTVLEGAGEPYTLTHQVSLVDDGMLVFVNDSPSDPCARTVRLERDGDRMIQSDVYEPTSCLQVLGLGGVVGLPAGGRLIAWSYLGTLEEIDADHQVVSRLTLPAGYSLGYPQHLDRLYPVE